MRQPRDHGQAGFTLPEVLIALALLAVIVSLLVEAIGSARLALQATDRQATHSTVPAVQAVLRRLMIEARAGPEAGERPDVDRAFIGARDQMSFISSFVPQGQYGGLWRYDLRLEEGGAGGALVVAQRLLRPAPSDAAGPPPPATRTVLLNGVQELHLRYFGVLDQEKAPQWQENWQHASRLPLLISVDVAFSRKDHRQWSAVVTAPALGR